MPHSSSAPAAASTALRLAGRDALDLLHRISTQALLDLAPGAARATAFCDFRGRLLHRATVARAADGAVWLLREDAAAAELAAYVERHIFREDVALEDLGACWSVRGALGTEPAPGAVIESGGVPRRVGLIPGLVLELVASGAPPDASALAAWERARIRSGWPRHGHEIAEAFHPFEVGLGDDVHLSKGCYTGQEVLQRLITYNSVRRRLARVGGEGEAPVTPRPACIEEERVGTVTSAVAEGDGWIGLAVLAERALGPDARVSVEDGAALTRIEPFAARPPRGRPAESSRPG